MIITITILFLLSLVLLSTRVSFQKKVQTTFLTGLLLILVNLGIKYLLTCIAVIMILAYTGYAVRHIIYSLVSLCTRQKQPKLDLKYTPFVSIIVPAHNEEKVIASTIDALLNLDYPNYELIVINDNSTDRTWEIIKSVNDPRLKAYNKPPSVKKTKAAALNFALTKAKGEILVFFDADYIPDPDVLLRFVRWFKDPKVGAVQGEVRVGNVEESYIPKILFLDRLAGFSVDMFARDYFGGVPQFGGTVGAIRKKIFYEIGEFDESALTEDTELTLRIVEAGYDIKYDDSIVCLEEAPIGVQARISQLFRWIKGHNSVLIRHVTRVLTSEKMSLFKKIDAIYLLFIYFVPMFITISLCIFGIVFAAQSSFYDPFKNLIYLYQIFVINLIFIGGIMTFTFGAIKKGFVKLLYLTPCTLGFAHLWGILCIIAFYQIATGSKNIWIKTSRTGRNEGLYFTFKENGQRINHVNGNGYLYPHKFLSKKENFQNLVVFIGAGIAGCGTILSVLSSFFLFINPSWVLVGYTVIAIGVITMILGCLLFFYKKNVIHGIKLFQRYSLVGIGLQ